MRYIYDTGREEETPDFDAFLEEILDVCRRHNKSIGHEDRHGGFLLYDGYDEGRAAWLRDASVDKDS